MTMRRELELVVGSLRNIMCVPIHRTMPTDLYQISGSPFCRSVRLVAKEIGHELNLKLTDLMTGDHLKPDYIKINPQHTIPTMVDNGFVLCESRAILTYLVDKYAKNDSLYPKDSKKRAQVNQRLYFDMGTLYQRFADYYYPVIITGADYDPAKFSKLGEAYGFLDKFLENQNWAAGDTITVADYAIISTVSTAQIIGFDIRKYPNVTKWFIRTKAAISGYDEINHAGCLEFKQFFDHMIAKK